MFVTACDRTPFPETLEIPKSWRKFYNLCTFGEVWALKVRSYAPRKRSSQDGDRGCGEPKKGLTDQQIKKGYEVVALYSSDSLL